jgi:hypothetical protein
LLQAPYNVFKDMEGPNIVRLFGEWSDWSILDQLGCFNYTDYIASK